MGGVEGAALVSACRDGWGAPHQGGLPAASPPQVPGTFGRLSSPPRLRGFPRGKRGLASRLRALSRHHGGPPPRVVALLARGAAWASASCARGSPREAGRGGRILRVRPVAGLPPDAASSRRRAGGGRSPPRRPALRGGRRQRRCLVEAGRVLRGDDHGRATGYLRRGRAGLGPALLSLGGAPRLGLRLASPARPLRRQALRRRADRSRGGLLPQLPHPPRWHAPALRSRRRGRAEGAR